MQSNPWLSRSIDVVVAVVALVLAAPLLLMIAIVIRLDGGRPVLFSQQRIGRDAAPFRMHKFRTLRVDDGHHPRRVTPTGDARVTRAGRVLRRLHLDELPQLFDVICGRMSLVGPRPETAENLSAVAPEDLAEAYARRPGMTGLTQLEFLAEDDVLAEVDDPTTVYRTILVPAKIAHTCAWSARRSLAGDLGILLRTPFTMLSRGARDRSRARVEDLIRMGA